VSAPDLSAVVARVLDLTFDRPPTLGTGRLVCVDGPAGSGKTTLATALVVASRARLVDTALLHMDDVYEGWTGLETAMSRVASDVIGPLREGRAGRYRRYDWERGALAEQHVIEPCDLLVVEGVGSAGSEVADAVTCLVWVEAPGELRLRRGLQRDGESMREHWVRWRSLEEEVLARERTRERADLVVDGG
jgi:uridine kinase